MIRSKQNCAVQAITGAVQRVPSIISRELARNDGPGHYHADHAQQTGPTPRWQANRLLDLKWSPVGPDRRLTSPALVTTADQRQTESPFSESSGMEQLVTKMPTACYFSTCPRTPTYQLARNDKSMRPPGSSTPEPTKPSTSSCPSRTVSRQSITYNLIVALEGGNQEE